MGTEIWSYTCSLVPARNYVGPIMPTIYIDDLPRHGNPIYRRARFPLSYLGGTSKLIPSVSPLHLAGPPKDLSTPFARYSGWHRRGKTRSRARSRVGRMPHLYYGIYSENETWSFSSHYRKALGKKAWGPEGVSGMQQVARFHDAGLRDRVRDKIHDPHWHDSQSISSLMVAIARPAR